MYYGSKWIRLQKYRLLRSDYDKMPNVHPSMVPNLLYQEKPKYIPFLKWAQQIHNIKIEFNRSYKEYTFINTPCYLLCDSYVATSQSTEFLVYLLRKHLTFIKLIFITRDLLSTFSPIYNKWCETGEYVYTEKERYFVCG